MPRPEQSRRDAALGTSTAGRSKLCGCRWVQPEATREMIATRSSVDVSDVYICLSNCLQLSSSKQNLAEELLCASAVARLRSSPGVVEAICLGG